MEKLDLNVEFHQEGDKIWIEGSSEYEPKVDLILNLVKMKKYYPSNVKIKQNEKTKRWEFSADANIKKPKKI